MIELHGWLKIQETYEDEDLLSQNEIEDIMQHVKAIIQSNTCGIKLQYANGETFLHTLFGSNHHTSEVDEIIETYKSISQIAIGSYGITMYSNNRKCYYSELNSGLSGKTALRQK